MKEPENLKAMPFWLSLVCFGIPFLIMTLGIYVFIPILSQWGMPLVWGFVVFFAGTLLLMLLSSLAAYRLEGNVLSWTSIKKRFRFKALKSKDWLWIAGLVIVIFTSNFVISPLAKWLVTIPIFEPPDYIPGFLLPGGLGDNNIPTELFGVPLKGNWWFVIGYLIFFCLNILGEEFWWRGYILPRQELTHGKWAWLVHGLLWTLYHGFLVFNLISHLIPCLAISFVASKQKSTSPSFLWHCIGNSFVLIIILLGVFGVQN